MSTTKHTEGSPPEDREQFIRDNAVALVQYRDTKIARLRERVRSLEKQTASLRASLKKMREAGLVVIACHDKAGMATLEECWDALDGLRRALGMRVEEEEESTLPDDS